LRGINTANFTFHDTPSDVSSTPGFRDAGFDNFGPAYEDWMNAETLLICGTDPYETKTVMFTQHVMKGIQNGQKAIFLVPRKTAGVAYALENGGLWLDVNPGTDLLVLNAIARIIVENDWQDKEWIENWVNDKWGSSSGFGQGTRNTPWQWRTTWGKFQTKGYEDWTKRNQIGGLRHNWPPKWALTVLIGKHPAMFAKRPPSSPVVVVKISTWLRLQVKCKARLCMKCFAKWEPPVFRHLSI
jgi:anaerobic selenocysteine-containing dehydrogenase